MAGVGLSLGFPKIISCRVVPTGGAEVATAPGRGGPDGRGCGRRGSAEVRGGPPVTRPCLFGPSISRDPRLMVVFEEGNSFAEIQPAHHTAPPSLCVPTAACAHSHHLSKKPRPLVMAAPHLLSVSEDLPLLDRVCAGIIHSAPTEKHARVHLGTCQERVVCDGRNMERTQMC